MGVVSAAATHPVADQAIPDQDRSSLLGRLLAGIDRNAFLIAALGVCAALQVAVIRTSLQADAWYTLVSGRLIVRHGLPHHDTLTVLSRGRPWVDQQWLAHVGLYALWAAAGMAAVLLSTVAFYVGTFAILGSGARRRGASDRSVALVTVLAFFVGIPNTVLRAQVPAYVLFGIVLTLLLSDASHRSRRVYLVLPLLALWANVHGSVLMGAMLVSLYGATVAVGGMRARRPAREYLLRAGALIGAPWACVLVSPYGLSLPAYYQRVLDNPTLSHAVSEWAPSTLRGEPLFFALLLGGLILATVGRRHLTPFAFLALLGTGLFGLLAVRNIVWFAFVATAVLPAALDAVWRPSSLRRNATVNLLLAAGSLCFLAVIAGAIVAHGNHWFEKSYPDKASSAVERAALAHPTSRVFANELYADWLLFEHPDLGGRIAYDTRLEIIPKGALARVIAFRSESGNDWQRAAAGYALFVLDPSDDRGAIRWLTARGARVLYRGPDAVVLARTGR
jgi:hypothetical protein